jgi:hypothetical protein
MPAIACQQLATFDATRLESIREAFQRATTIPLGQHWLEKSEADFQPGSVRIGWRDAKLLIFAELLDRDIFTTATAHNQWLHELGDVFEIFLRPTGSEAYFEFHIAPNNLRLQLRFPDAGAFRRRETEDCRFDDPFLEHRVWLEADRWSVLAQIPIAKQGDEWRFSFSRYDYTRGRNQPVTSSSSPHTVLSFHQQEAWGKLQFV